MQDQQQNHAIRPELAAFVQAQADELARDPSIAALGPVEIRRRAETNFPLRWGSNEDFADISDQAITSGGQELMLRLYRVQGACGTILFFHGGGWANGSIDTHEGPCRMLARIAQAHLVSVNYRKAPENPYPAALDDAEAALVWLRKHGAEFGLAGQSIVVSGESAGGNIAAALAIRARDRGIGLAGQALIYPATDLRAVSQSYDSFASGFGLTKAGMQTYIAAYCGQKTGPDNPEISPLLAPRHRGLPPTHLTTCQLDPLRDEGRAYAARLIEAGVDVTFREYAEAIHGIWLMKAITPLAQDIIGETGHWIRRQLTA